MKRSQELASTTCLSKSLDVKSVGRFVKDILSLKNTWKNTKHKIEGQEVFLTKRGVNLHYKKLLEAHKAFYRGEHRARNYDRYMLQQKNWEKWKSPIVPIDEIEKLFRFIRSWDRFFQGDPEVFQKIYKEIYPILDSLKREKV